MDNKGKETAYSGTSKQKVQKKQDKEITCFFCKKTGHMKKTCTKYAVWLEKKVRQLPKWQSKDKSSQGEIMKKKTTSKRRVLKTKAS
ncbi:hypothetical protein CK203_097823 [Vitis vinifera]|uniref:CCHC-type domain-containing protein n=1 Tax=Vitis vinifera TaxID=29760 RepID=A0A438DFP5_VITVI|nr:hypothetical protein CK203_097823 [Vitis vinifera]